MLSTIKRSEFPSRILRPMYGPWGCAYCCEVATVAPIVLFWPSDLPVHLRFRGNALPYHLPRPSCERCVLDLALDRLWNAAWQAQAGDLYAGTPIDWNLNRMALVWGTLGNYGN